MIVTKIRKIFQWQQEPIFASFIEKKIFNCAKMQHQKLRTFGHSPISGMTLPTARYANSLSKTFPNSQRTYKVETSIIGRYMRDHLPINSNLTNVHVSDNYIEFVLMSNRQEFIDFNAFVLGIKIKIVTPVGKPVPDNSKQWSRILDC